MWLHIPGSPPLASAQESKGWAKACASLSQTFESCCTSSGKSRQRRYWQRACATAWWTRLLSTPISQKPLAIRKCLATFVKRLREEESTSSSEDRLASLTLSPGNASAETTIAICSPLPCGLLKSSSQESSSSKTSLDQKSTCPKGLSLFCMGTGIECQDRSCWKPQPSEQVRSVRGFLSWQSMTSVDAASRAYVYPSGDHDNPFLTVTGQGEQWNHPSSQGGGNVSRGNDRVDELLLAGQAQQFQWPAATTQDSENDAPPSQNERNTPPLNAAAAAFNWPGARSEDGECCGNHPGAMDSLGGGNE